MGPRDVLVDAWSGLPSITIVDDVLVGPVLQVASDSLMPVATWKVVARFVVPLLMIVMTVVGLVSFIVWAVRWRKKTTTDSRAWLRMLPLIASGLLVTYLTIWTLGATFLDLLGRVSWLSVGLFVLSCAYPLVVLAGVACLLTAKARGQRNWPYWFATAFVGVHLLIAAYMTEFGAIAIRTWA